MIDWARHHGRQADEFRIVQGHILQALAAKPAVAPARDNIIMVTSARPGEGKTYSSLNLAGSLTTCSRRAVILVDADIKRHTLTSNLGLDGRDGLLNLGSRTGFQDTDLLVGTPTAPPLAPPLLRILPVGVGRAESGITAGRFLIDALGQLADQHPECLIVVDTPPCLSSSGPSTLAPLVGHVMMVVEAQQTQRAEVEAALDLIEACGSVVLMLNKVQLTGSDTFGAYGY
jgi:receptor protein-tyrosine kinase